MSGQAARISTQFPTLQSVHDERMAAHRAKNTRFVKGQRVLVVRKYGDKPAFVVSASMVNPGYIVEYDSGSVQYICAEDLMDFPLTLELVRKFKLEGQRWR